MDELWLISECQRGGVRGLQAFNTLVLAHQTQAYNVACRILGDEARAADVTQDAFISVFNAMHRFRGGSFKAFVLRTVTNACFDVLRYDKRHPQVSLDSNDDFDDETNLTDVLPSPESTPPDTAERNELRAHIQKASQQLPPDQRAVFVLCDVQGLAYAEVAEILRMPVGTVKSRLSRARAKLRAYLLAQAELLPLDFRLKQ